MDREHLLDCLDLDEERSLDDDVCPIRPIELDAFVDQRDGSLALEPQSVQAELVPKQCS
jgi:hypothetical protein